jgi:FKBP-type peptidyl-prolyl cis-trans isomerase 2/SAM-dependent methyltransferase
MDGNGMATTSPVIDGTAHAEILFTLEWEADGTRFSDRRLAPRLRMDYDLFPEGLETALLGKRAGDRPVLDFPPGRFLPPPDPARVARLPIGRFDERFIPGRVLTPAVGRFFPQGIVADGVPGVFKAGSKPCRILANDGETLTIDLNHPLAGRAVRLLAEVRSVSHDAGGGARCLDWTEILADGPGIQVRHGDEGADFWAMDGFRRTEDGDDAAFYAKPRMVVHLDAAALAQVTEIYREHLSAGMQVLDLMSSHRSHLPDDVGVSEVIGIGLNGAEMAGNPQLAGHEVHDLNANPRLPFGTAAFDAAVCTVSVEYLIHPREVFRDVARVLRPGAPFVATFSHRWFPPKVTRIWTELHPFERVGFVLECFRDSGFFTDLGASSLRGLPRPTDDGHYPRETESDPVFAVWGRRIS